MDIIARLIEQLASEEEIVRVQAGEFLIQMGSAAVRPLIEALKNPQYKARPLVAATLGQIGDRRAVEPLTQALKDDDKLVRYYAALALGKLKDRRAIKPLIYALFDEMPPTEVDPLTGDLMTVRGAAAQALGELRAVEAVPALKVLMRDENKSVRRSVITALGQIGTREAILALQEAIWQESDEALSEMIIRILAFNQSIETLQQISESHPQERLRKLAQSFLHDAQPKPVTLEAAIKSEPFLSKRSKSLWFLVGAIAAILLAAIFKFGWKQNRYATVAFASIIAAIAFGFKKFICPTRTKQLPPSEEPIKASVNSRETR